MVVSEKTDMWAYFSKPVFRVIGNCDAIVLLHENAPRGAQTAVAELIATQYRSRARVLQAKLFVLINQEKSI